MSAKSPKPRGTRPVGPQKVRGPRRGATLVVLAGLAVAGVLYASCARVAPGERVFRVTRGRGAERLAPGWHLVVPGAQRVARVASGPLHVSETVPARSREGVSFEIPCEVTAEIDDAGLGGLLARSSGGDPAGAIRTAAEDEIRRWTERASGEDLVLRQGAREVEAAARGRLEALGFGSVSFRIGPAQGPSEVLASVQAGALRDRVADTRTRIALIGLDGADWQIIDPLMAKGELPHLARLRARGAWGNLKSLHPMLSPLLWTSVATGKPPDQHGIIDFLVQDPKTGQAVPISSRRRQVKALWNIFTDAGRTSDFIGWWATWPAEPINGTIVSDRVAYSLFGFQSSDADRPGATWPADYYAALRPKLVDDSQIPLRDVQEFARVTPSEFAALRARIKENPRTAYREPVNHLTKILASARSYQAAARDLLARGQPDLFSIYYQGIDEVCHRFAHCMPPKMAMVTDAEYAAYKDAVFAYYRYQDRLLGEIVDRLAPDTTVIVLSDHGFRNGSDRPTDAPPYIEGKPALWHRRYGIVLFAGPPVRPGRLDTTDLLDIAPTVLYLSGFPVPEDMPGRVVVEAIREEFRHRFPQTGIRSYEGIGRPHENGGEVVADATADAEMLENLRSLGYIGDTAGQSAAGRGSPPPGGGPAGGASAEGTPARAPVAGGTASAGPAAGGQTLVTGYLNEAAIEIKNKNFPRARGLIEQAIRADPKLVFAQTMMAEVEAGEKHYAAAIETANRVLESDPEGERGLFVPLSRYYADGGRAKEGVSWYRRALGGHPAISEAHAGLGYLLLKLDDRAGAEKELLESLRLDPSQTDPLTTLHTLYENTEKVLSLEPIVRQGLKMNGKSVVHHNWMGLIQQWKKDVPGAEREFRIALDLDPDDAGTMANLGALYGRNGRLQEAVAILSRSVAKDPENLESWVNLGAAQGRLGHAREAIQALETARGKGLKTTTLYNALALAYLQDHQRDRALEYLRESLRIDPSQKDAHDLLSAVERPPRS
jgi:tetratricopeptide (TPR) repeat protein